MSWASISHKIQVSIKFSVRALDFNLVKSELATCHAQREQSDSSYYFYTHSLFSLFYKLHQTLCWKQLRKIFFFFLFFLFRWSLPLDSVRMKKQVFIKGEAALGTTYLFTRSFPVHQSSLCKWFMKDQASKNTHLNNETWPATTVLLTIWLPKMNFRSYLLLYSSYASKQRSCLIFLRWFDLILPVNKI